MSASEDIEKKIVRGAVNNEDISTESVQNESTSSQINQEESKRSSDMNMLFERITESGEQELKIMDPQWDSEESQESKQREINELYYSELPCCSYPAIKSLERIVDETPFDLETCSSTILDDSELEMKIIRKGNNRSEDLLKIIKKRSKALPEKSMLKTQSFNNFSFLGRYDLSRRGKRSWNIRSKMNGKSTRGEKVTKHVNSFNDLTPFISKACQESLWKIVDEEFSKAMDKEYDRCLKDGRGRLSKSKKNIENSITVNYLKDTIYRVITEMTTEKVFSVLSDDLLNAFKPEYMQVMKSNMQETGLINQILQQLVQAIYVEEITKDLTDEDKKLLYSSFSNKKDMTLHALLNNPIFYQVMKQSYVKGDNRQEIEQQTALPKKQLNKSNIQNLKSSDVQHKRRKIKIDPQSLQAPVILPKIPKSITKTKYPQYSEKQRAKIFEKIKADPNKFAAFKKNFINEINHLGQALFNPNGKNIISKSAKESRLDFHANMLSGKNKKNRLTKGTDSHPLKPKRKISRMAIPSLTENQRAHTLRPWKLDSYLKKRGYSSGMQPSKKKDFVPETANVSQIKGTSKLDDIKNMDLSAIFAKQLERINNSKLASAKNDDKSLKIKSSRRKQLKEFGSGDKKLKHKDGVEQRYESFSKRRFMNADDPYASKETTLSQSIAYQKDPIVDSKNKNLHMKVVNTFQKTKPFRNNKRNKKGDTVNTGVKKQQKGVELISEEQLLEKKSSVSSNKRDESMIYWSTKIGEYTAEEQEDRPYLFKTSELDLARLKSSILSNNTNSKAYESFQTAKYQDNDDDDNFSVDDIINNGYSPWSRLSPYSTEMMRSYLKKNITNPPKTKEEKYKNFYGEQMFRMAYEKQYTISKNF